MRKFQQEILRTSDKTQFKVTPQIVRVKERKPKHFLNGSVLIPEVSLEIDTSSLSSLHLKVIRSAINLGALRIKLVEEDLPSSLEEAALRVTGEL